MLLQQQRVGRTSSHACFQRALDLEATQPDVRHRVAAQRGQGVEHARVQPPIRTQPELETVTTALLREKGIFSAWGALELLLAMHSVDANEPQLAAYFARAGGLGERVLHCCNESHKVLSDHGGKLHTAESLAKLVFTIKRRLNQDAHDTRPGDEYARDGDAIVLRCNGLSQSHVALLRCLFVASALVVGILVEAALDGKDELRQRLGGVQLAAVVTQDLVRLVAAVEHTLAQTSGSRKVGGQLRLVCVDRMHRQEKLERTPSGKDALLAQQRCGDGLQLVHKRIAAPRLGQNLQKVCVLDAKLSILGAKLLQQPVDLSVLGLEERKDVLIP